MNIYDISQKAGVSIATVSRELLNGSEKVSEKARKGYLLLWKKQLYPQCIVKSLGLNSMHTVGILVQTPLMYTRHRLFIIWSGASRIPTLPCYAVQDMNFPKSRAI